MHLLQSTLRTLTLVHFDLKRCLRSDKQPVLVETSYLISSKVVAPVLESGDNALFGGPNWTVLTIQFIINTFLFHPPESRLGVCNKVDHLANHSESQTEFLASKSGLRIWQK